jgi:hypothetical protein
MPIHNAHSMSTIYSGSAIEDSKMLACPDDIEHTSHMHIHKPKPLIQAQIISLIPIPPHRIPRLIQPPLLHLTLRPNPTTHQMQCLLILPNNLTTPTKLSLTHPTREMTTSIIPLYFITASCFGTFFRCACYFAFCACFVFPCSALGFFCFFGGLGEDMESGFLLVDFLGAFLCVDGTEVVAGDGRLFFADIAVPL